MKRFVNLLLCTLALLFGSSVHAQLPPYGLYQMQVDAGGSFFWGRYMTPASPTTSYFLMYDGATSQPAMGALGTGLSFSGGTLALGSIPISSVTNLQTSLNAKFTTPAGTTSQVVLGDGTLGALPSAFNYGDPSARTLSVSTAYQANDPSKAAVITVSPQCTNATTVLAASACTMQVRFGTTSGLTCSTGTVTHTWTSTYALGLLLTNASGSPFDVKLGVGRYFILCPTAGTFTITTAVDQTAG